MQALQHTLQTNINLHMTNCILVLFSRICSGCSPYTL
jgi:hypothetical protein